MPRYFISFLVHAEGVHSVTEIKGVEVKTKRPITSTKELHSVLKTVRERNGLLGRTITPVAFSRFDGEEEESRN